MGKEPNTVKSNVVGKFRDFSAQDSQLEFQPSDFHDDTDSTILVRERTKGSKLEPTFARKTGKVIEETSHTIAILPEKAKQPKIFSKRDIASTSSEQKKVLKKAAKRATINETSSSSESEQSAHKKGKTQKQGTTKTPEFAIEFDEEMPPSIIDISSTTTENESSTKEQPKDADVKKENYAPKENNKPEKVTIPIKATTVWQMDRRVSERKHVPPKRYGIDLISKRQKKQVEEEKKASGEN